MMNCRLVHENHKYQKCKNVHDEKKKKKPIAICFQLQHRPGSHSRDSRIDKIKKAAQKIKKKNEFHI